MFRTHIPQFIAIVAATAPLAMAAPLGIVGDGVPDVVIDVATGQATLDTDGAGTLAAFSIVSRGANNSIGDPGDGDGYLTAGLTVPGSGGFADSSRDELFRALGTLASGVYPLGQLYDPTLVPGAYPLSPAFILSDLRVAYDGDDSLVGNGTVRIIPEPASIAVLTAASLLLRRRVR
jgi:hypothetical protein